MSQATQKQLNRPNVQYRIQVQKRIQINRSYKQRRNQAIALRILSYGLFGRKRYQNIYLSCSLNCLFFALKIANTIHQRVAGLAMIVKFQNLDVIEYFSEEFQGKTYANKKYSRIVIKLTRTPSQDDKKQPGYNPGLNANDIKYPITQVMNAKKRGDGNFNRSQRPYRDHRENNYKDRRGGRNYDHQDRRGGRNYDYHQDRRRGKNYNNHQDRRPRRQDLNQDQGKDYKKGYKNQKKSEDTRTKHIQQNQTQDKPTTEYTRGAQKTRGGNNQNIGNRQEARDDRGQRKPKSRYQDDDS